MWTIYDTVFSFIMAGTIMVSFFYAVMIAYGHHVSPSPIIDKVGQIVLAVSPAIGWLTIATLLVCVLGFAGQGNGVSSFWAFVACLSLTPVVGMLTTYVWEENPRTRITGGWHAI